MPEKKPTSQSQKIRFILYKIWEQNNEGLSFDEYYFKQTQEIIDTLQKKLEPPLPDDPYV